MGQKIQCVTSSLFVWKELQKGRCAPFLISALVHFPVKLFTQSHEAGEHENRSQADKHKVLLSRLKPRLKLRRPHGKNFHA